MNPWDRAGQEWIMWMYDDCHERVVVHLTIELSDPGDSGSYAVHYGFSTTIASSGHVVQTGRHGYSDGILDTLGERLS